MSEVAAPRHRYALLAAERAALILGVWQFLDHALASRCISGYG